MHRPYERVDKDEEWPLLTPLSLPVATTRDRVWVKLPARKAKLGLFLRVGRLVLDWNCQKKLSAVEQAQWVQMHFVQLPREFAGVRFLETDQESCCRSG